MIKMKKLLSLVLAIALVMAVFTGCAKTEKAATPETKKVEWPTEAVTIVSPAKAGGFADVHSRILADYLQRSTGVPFVVLNISDGGGNVGTDKVKNAKPDGKTLLHFHTGVPVSFYTGISTTDPKNDLTIIAATQTGGNHVFVASKNAPYNNIEELVQYAKANPEKVKWGATAGVTSHFMMGMMEQEAGVKFRMIDAGTDAERVTAMLGGFLDVTNISINAAHQHVQAGNMKILGVIADERDKNFPQYPTILEQGYDVVWAGAFGLYGPANMDPELVKMINEALKGYEDDEKTKEALAKVGSDFTYKNVEESKEYYYEQFTLFEELAKKLGLIK